MTESALVLALKEHRPEAYEYLYTHYRSALYGIILPFFNEEESARDTLQDVFVQIWKNIGQYDSQKGRLFTWMSVLARNAAINQLRKKNVRVHGSNLPIENYVSVLEQQSHEPDLINRIGLRRMIHALKPEYCQVLELAYFEGLKQEEIAQLLNVPLGTIKSRIRQALILLRKQFV